ncbi:MAG: hypothetical protein HQK51_21790, partial [Oligoflexia bacterium]|nr:hypothetical protein [Oligoflexia bacterium]
NLNITRMISWYENQQINKYFYLGLREVYPEIFIYGSQPFIFGKHFFSYIPAKAEKECKILPDKILTNGAYFLKFAHKENRQIYSIGPSFRYDKLFKYNFKFDNQTKIMSGLSHLDDANMYLLDKLSRTSLKERTLMVRKHPDSGNINLHFFSQNW